MSFSNRRPDFWGTAVTGVMLLVPVAAVLGLRFVGPWPVVVLLLVLVLVFVVLVVAVVDEFSTPRRLNRQLP